MVSRSLLTILKNTKYFKTLKKNDYMLQEKNPQLNTEMTGNESLLLFARCQTFCKSYSVGLAHQWSVVMWLNCIDQKTPTNLIQIPLIQVELCISDSVASFFYVDVGNGFLFNAKLTLFLLLERNTGLLFEIPISNHFLSNIPEICFTVFF